MTLLTRVIDPLARLITARQKAAEGEYRPGPWLTMDGWLPHAWGQYANFWQMGYDPIPGGTSSIVEACVWAYIRAIAQLPGYHRRELENGGVETITTSALSRLLRVPNDYQTHSDFLVHLIRSLLLTGNSYWVAQRNERNEVAALHWTDPRTCRVYEIAVPGSAFKEVFYSIGANPLIDTEQIANVFDSDRLIVPARDVLHFKLATPRHPLIGETWLASLWVELSGKAAIEANARTVAGNMSRPSGVLQTDMTLTKAQVDELRERWNAQAAGMNAGGVPILTSGLKFEKVSLSAADQQVIEQLKLSDRAITAVFGVPPLLLGVSDAGGTKSAEAQMAEWLASGLGWLINHIEVGFDAFIGLPRPEYTEYDTRALLRTAFKERIEGLVRGVQGGVFAPNEARELEGYGPAKAGDEPRVQQQLLPLSAVTEPSKPTPAPAAPAPPALPGDDDTSDSSDEDNPAKPRNEDEARALLAFRIRKHVNERTHERAA